jgi:hypothetical protein
MFQERKLSYKTLQNLRSSKLLVYITGDRPGLSTQIHPEVIDFFSEHLDNMTGKRRIPKISLYIYTRGGHTLAAWSIANLIRQFCEEFEVIIPAKAHSAGTIICLGATKIIMTKQATLSPIDPNFNGPLNPVIPGAPPQNTVPVSVEAINGYFELAKEQLKIRNRTDLTKLLISLSEKVHPLVLGETYRVRNQIRMLASRLLSQQIAENTKVKKIVSFLAAESGSHDYTINRREATDDLGLPIEKPDDNLYDIIKNIYDDIREELQLNTPYNPQNMFGESDQVDYCLRQAFIESLETGTHVFCKKGTLRRLKGTDQRGLPQILINDQLSFQGWHYEPAENK